MSQTVDEEEAPRKRRKLAHRESLLASSSEQVTVKLAGHDKQYSINKALICRASTFFFKTFTVDMAESSSKCVTLHDVDPTIFETFIYWLYERVIQLPDGAEKVTKDNLLMFIDLYIFADCYDTFELRNSVVTAVGVAVWNNSVTSFRCKDIGAALDKLRSTSELYAMLVAFSHGGLDQLASSQYEAICMYYPSAVVAILMENLAKRRLIANSLGQRGLDSFIETEVEIALA